MRRLPLVLSVLLACAGCAGTSEFQRCVDHSVEEGVARDVAERSCERAVGRDG